MHSPTFAASVLHLLVVLTLCSCHLMLLGGDTTLEPRYQLVLHSLIASSIVAFNVTVDLMKANGILGLTNHANDDEGPTGEHNPAPSKHHILLVVSCLYI